MSSTLISRQEPDIDKLVKTYGNQLLRMCFLYLKNIHQAEDAVQDTFINIFKNYSQFRGDSAEKTWIMRIAINVCKNYLRSSWWKHVDYNRLLKDIPSSVNDRYHDDTLIIEILKLSTKYKEVILLFYYQEMKTKEIAEVLNIPESTVSVRLARARKLLKTNLEGWYYDR